MKHSVHHVIRQPLVHLYRAISNAFVLFLAFTCDRGVTLQDLKDFPGAGRSYRNAIECRPSLALAHLNLGIVLRTVQNTSEAEKVVLLIAAMDAYLQHFKKIITALNWNRCQAEHA